METADEISGLAASSSRMKQDWETDLHFGIPNFIVSILLILSDF